MYAVKHDYPEIADVAARDAVLARPDYAFERLSSEITVLVPWVRF